MEYFHDPKEYFDADTHIPYRNFYNYSGCYSLEYTKGDKEVGFIPGTDMRIPEYSITEGAKLLSQYRASREQHQAASQKDEPGQKREQSGTKSSSSHNNNGGSSSHPVSLQSFKPYFDSLMENAKKAVKQNKGKTLLFASPS